MSFLKDFRDFAVKGNVVDLAVGVIVGAAFSKIVDSIVKDLVMPLIGAVIGSIDLTQLYIVLGTIPEGTANTLETLQKAAVPVLAYGNFLTILVNFVILAFVIFVMVRQINVVKNRVQKEIEKRTKAEEKAKADAIIASPPSETPEVLLLREIRDAIKSSSAR